jgi:nicotinate-nucleotide adenylyltransferase
MGGYFNPIHNWHLLLGDCAAFQFKLDKVLYIPSGQPPHPKKHLLDGNVRFKLVETAVASNPLFQASRIEIDRPGVTWSIDTLAELKKQYGEGVRLNFIIGEDNIPAIAGYDKRKELVALCRLLVACRGTADAARLKAWREAVPEATIEAIECPASDLSSTLVRDRIVAGLPYRYLVPAGVYTLCEEQKLYREATTTCGANAAPATPAVNAAPSTNAA